MFVILLCAFITPHYLSRHFPHRNLPLSFKPASNHFCRIPNLLSPPPLSLLALLSTWTPPSFTSSLYQFYHISSHPPQENTHTLHRLPTHPLVPLLAATKEGDLSQRPGCKHCHAHARTHTYTHTHTS